MSKTQKEASVETWKIILKKVIFIKKYAVKAKILQLFSFTALDEDWNWCVQNIEI